MPAWRVPRALRRRRSFARGGGLGGSEMNRLLYALHKWISAIAFVQLAVWTVSGFTFTWITQDAIKRPPVGGAKRAAPGELPRISVPRAMQVAAAAAGAIERVDL